MSDFRCQACRIPVKSVNSKGAVTFTIYQSTSIYQFTRKISGEVIDLTRKNPTRYLCAQCTDKINDMWEVFILPKTCCICKSIADKVDEDGDCYFTIIQSAHVVKWHHDVIGCDASKYLCRVCKDKVRQEFPDLL